MSTIFISYRREDSGGYTGRLHDRLVQEWGKDRVFIDIDNIEPGEDFVEVIERVLSQAGVMVVVVGPRWLTATDAKGRRRIDSSSDYHRMEIEAALKRPVRVIPVLMGGATMPEEEELPDALKAFARRNAIEISDKRFGFDTARLVEAIGRVLNPKVPVVEAAKEVRGPEAVPSQQEVMMKLPPLEVKSVVTPSSTRQVAGGVVKRPEGGISKMAVLLVAGLLVLVAVGRLALRGCGSSPATDDSSRQQGQAAKPVETPSAPVSSQPAATQPDSTGTMAKPSTSSAADTAKTKKVVDAFVRQTAWISDKLTGHYRENTVSGRVFIRSVGGAHKLFIDAQQAKFNCDLKFGENGDPETASNCVVTDPYQWWTKDVVHFTCGVSGKLEVCQGAYMLHFNPDDKYEGEPTPPERRIMRIERPNT